MDPLPYSSGVIGARLKLKQQSIQGTGPMKELKVLGIDLAKNVFQLHGLDSAHEKVISERVKRAKFRDRIRRLQPQLICMEACSGAHHWARSLEAEGFTVKLLPPHRVKAFVRGSKNDGNDAEAIAMAGLQPSIRGVAIKTLAQQDIQSLHRVRQQAMQQRVATINQARGLLAEYGIVINQGPAAFRQALPEILEVADNGLTDLSRSLLNGLLTHFRELDRQVKQYDRDMEALTRALDPCRRLVTVPGVGPMVATAFFATLGDAQHFKNGREASAFLGLVPRQHSSGERQQLLGITKRGDRYLRTLLIHGARSVVHRADSLPGSRGEWLRKLIERRGTQKATVALANKNARILWALMANGGTYAQEASAT